jgi:hypothetical protein
VVSQDTYITRLDLIRTPWFEIKMHWMHGADPERDPHDHPWPFLSIILRGAYIEKRLVDYTTCGLPFFDTLHHRWYNWMPDPTVAHRIVAVDPGTVTLLFTGPRRREWGFRTAQGWVSRHNYKDA